MLIRSLKSPNDNPLITSVQCSSTFINNNFNLEITPLSNLYYSLCCVFLKIVIWLFSCIYPMFLIFGIFSLCLHSQYQFLRIFSFWLIQFFYMLPNQHFKSVLCNIFKSTCFCLWQGFQFLLRFLCDFRHFHCCVPDTE